MKQTLVLGSTVVDVLLSVPAVPRRGDDVNITAREYRIGGCAYNVFKTLRLFKSPALLCSPVGQGVFGDMVKKHFEKEGMEAFASIDEENGCCYCLVEPDGERSFLSLHGAEYRFYRSWMEGIDYSRTGSVFICGLEVEESTGNEIIDFVYERPELELFFAPGPRIKLIPKKKMERIFNRRDSSNNGPLIHLNQTEAFRFTGKRALDEAAKFLAGKTGNRVVITLGERGCYCLEKTWREGRYVQGFPAKVIDTVGAGDAHCGALIACLKAGMGLEEACLKANRIGAAVVGIKGAVLDVLDSASNLLF
jgi:sugar/nucleoside kinase (ribokinase family)